MTGPVRPTSVKVDGHEFNGVEASGLEWKFHSITGWHEGPATFVPQQQRIVSHGQFAQKGRRGGKTLVMKGSIEVPHESMRDLMPRAIDRLNALLADGQFGPFEFTDRTDGMRWTDVQLLDAPDVSWDGGVRATYLLQLLAPSAYRFGAVSQAGTGFAAAPAGAGLVFNLFPSGKLDFGTLGNVGQAAVTNLGTADAPVRFTITGPTPTAGFVIRDTVTGAQITFLGQVPAGSTLVIDSANGSVVIDGTADRLGDTIVEEWPIIPPGQTRAFLFEPNGTSTASQLTVSTTATYW